MDNTTTADNAIQSIRQLAKAVGKSPTAVAGWLKDDRWTFDTAPPWRREDVPAMRQWARETLKPDPAAEYNNSDEFYDRWGRPFPPITIHTDDFSGGAGRRDRRKEALREGPELCTPFERDVISGNRKATEAEVRDYIARTVALKARLVGDQANLSAWLVGRPEKEIYRRIRAATYERLAWFAQVFATDPETRQLGMFSVKPEDE